MKPIIRYYTKLIDYYASISIGDEAVIVSRLKEQPPEGWNHCEVLKTRCFFAERYGVAGMYIKLQFPGGSTIGMPQKPDVWFSPATMKNNAIRLLWTVTGTRVCEAQKVSPKEILDMGIINIQAGFIEADILSEFKNWYLTRYPEGNWKDWVEVTTVRRESHDN